MKICPWITVLLVANCTASSPVGFRKPLSVNTAAWPHRMHKLISPGVGGASPPPSASVDRSILCPQNGQTRPGVIKVSGSFLIALSLQHRGYCQVVSSQLHEILKRFLPKPAQHV